MDGNDNSSSRNNGSRATMTPRSNAHREALSRVPCRYYNSESGSGCYRGKDCWFLHDMASQDTSPNPSAESSSAPPAETSSGHETTCGICLEQPTKFGLMVNCSHVFCLYCIRKWRDRDDKTEETVIGGMHKTCPTCRKHCDYIIPSNVFYAHETPEKEAETKKYLDNISKIPCRHFSNSPSSARFCPFGNSCHYAHKVNGSPYIFTRRELAGFEVRRARRAIQNNAENMLYELSASRAVLGLGDNPMVMWNILDELIEDDLGFGGLYGQLGGGGYPPWYDDDDDEEDEDYEDEEDEEDDDDDDFEDDGSDDEIPELVDDDRRENLPDLVEDDLDDETMPRLRSYPDELLELADILQLADDSADDSDSDSMPELVDDSDNPPDLVGNSDAEDIPDLISDSEDEHEPKTTGDRSPHSTNNVPPCCQPQVHLNGQRRESRPRVPVSTSSSSGFAVSNSSSPQARPTPPASNTIQRDSESQKTVPQTPPATPSAALRSPTGFTPASRLRRFSPPQHTPPPGPRRPHPPNTRNPEPARSSTNRSNVRTNVSDELGWDEDGATENSDAELSEREKQRIRESEERGINARDWTSRAMDLSYFSR